MGKFIRHGIGAAVGALLGMLVTLAAARGIVLDPEQVSAAASAITTGLTLFVTLVGYALVEKFLKRFRWLDIEGFASRLLVKQKAAQIDPEFRG